MPVPNLPQSALSTTILSTSTAGSVLNGTPGHDQLTAGATRVTLVGGDGDDVYYVFKASASYARSGTSVVESAIGGIDTVYSPSSFVLPSNVENLYLTSTAGTRYAIGNGGDNILSSGAGTDYLTTGGGNDVLFGGIGVDTFSFTKALNTTSWIADFEAGVDRLILTHLGFNSFNAVLAAATQDGPDLAITAADGQKIMVANATAADLDPARVVVDTPSLATGAFRNLTFNEDFDGPLSLDTGTAATAGGTWRTFYYSGNGDRRIYANNELQYYVDPDATGKGGVPLNLNPFVIEDGILHIQARPTDPALLPALWNVPYTSGLLTTQFSFQQQYGYFEIRAETPSGKGLWPAFWMLPVDKSWPPEIDIFEQIGSQTSSVLHGVLSAAQPTATMPYATGVDMTQAFHTYALEWTAQTITWFIDGVQTFQVDTPGDLHKPMYLLVNLAVGGNWPGTPDGTVDWSKADLLVDYVRAYSLDANQPPVGLEITISNAADATDLSDSFVLPLATPDTSATFTGAQMQIAGVPNSATVTAAYAANGDLTLTNNAAWNTIKNATITDTDVAANGVSVHNFVDVELSLGQGGDRVDITGIKRGLIDTGAGHDTITISGNSNSTSSNVTVVLAGDGDDVVTFGGNKYNRANVDGGAGDDQLTLLGQIVGSITGGAGDDVLTDRSTGAVTLNGGVGADAFAFGVGVKATVGDFVAGTDQIQLIGVNPAGVSSSIVGADTVVTFGVASIKLLGVNLSFAQLDIHYV